ncbi:AAA family ATPase, partial [Chenggangzhangella methanolivorans]|uniref:AAA family ATPase n=1 Tax=Chenggangzhangella methanolivorans TaxID=1437009 RepID=UPI00360BFA57
MPTILPGFSPRRGRSRSVGSEPEAAMRLLRLDLEKYGAFEGRALVFRPDARLHLVFGPNEAGKSSALSAVGDLLFGFGQRTDFAFRHATGELRLGALIADAEGREVFFRRRKGAKATLIDADDKPLRDDLLAPFLGALGRETFERAFGLTSDALRKGGEELRKADGEAGASLFAAASGLRGLEEKRRGLDEEADALFRPQASTRRFNEEFRAFEAARKEVAANELGQTEWKRLNEAIAALETRHAELERRLAETRTDRARIERLGRARRAATGVDETRRALEDQGEAPDLTIAGAAALARALDAAEAAREAAGRAAGALKALEAEVASAGLDEAALGAAEAIERAFRQSGAYATLQTDLPRVRREAEEREAALAQLAERLGLPDVAAVEAARPTDAARAELKAMIEDGRERARASAERAKAIAAERERLFLLERDRGPLESIDPRPFREIFAGLSPRLRSLDRREAAAAEAGAEARALAEAAARLLPPVGDLDQLAGRAVPGAETIARHRGALDRLDADIARAAEALARDEAESARAASEARALASSGPIASPEAVRMAREARRAGWERLRTHLFGLAPLEPGELAAAVSELEAAMAEADRLADRAAEDAGRAAREAELKRRGEDLAAALHAGRARRTALEAGRGEALEDWRGAWAPSGVSPATPAEMEGWRKDVAALLDRRERNGRRLADLAALDAQAAELRPELAALGAEIGLKGVEDLSARALGERIEERLAALDEVWRDAAEAAAAIGELGRRLARLEAEEQAAQAGAAARAALWSSACAAAGLAPESALSGAAAALAAWDEAPALIAEREDRSRRVRGIVRDSALFSDQVAELVGAVAPDLADLAPDAAARRLNDRLTAARAAETRRVETSRRLVEARRSASAAAERRAEASAAVAAASSAFPEGADLRDALARFAARQKLAETLAERRAQLLMAGERPDEETLRGELASFDPDAAPAAIEALGADEARLVAEDREVFAELTAQRARRDALGGSA